MSRFGRKDAPELERGELKDGPVSSTVSRICPDCMMMRVIRKIITRIGKIQYWLIAVTLVPPGCSLRLDGSSGTGCLFMEHSRTRKIGIGWLALILFTDFLLSFTDLRYSSDYF